MWTAWIRVADTDPLSLGDIPMLLSQLAHKDHAPPFPIRLEQHPSSVCYHQMIIMMSVHMLFLDTAPQSYVLNLYQ